MIHRCVDGTNEFPSAGDGQLDGRGGLAGRSGHDCRILGMDLRVVHFRQDQAEPDLAVARFNFVKP